MRRGVYRVTSSMAIHCREVCTDLYTVGMKPPRLKRITNHRGTNSLRQRVYCMQFKDKGHTF